MASGDFGPSAGDLLRFSFGIVSVVFNPSDGVSWIDLHTTFVGLAAALTTNTLYVELDFVVTEGPKPRELGRGWITHYW